MRYQSTSNSFAVTAWPLVRPSDSERLCWSGGLKIRIAAAMNALAPGKFRDSVVEVIDLTDEQIVERPGGR
jgi:hypothetical protein